MLEFLKLNFVEKEVNNLLFRKFEFNVKLCKVAKKVRYINNI